MRHWLVVAVCSLGMAVSCGDDSSPSGGTGGSKAGGAGGTAVGGSAAGGSAAGGSAAGGAAAGGAAAGGAGGAAAGGAAAGGTVGSGGVAAGGAGDAAAGADGGPDAPVSGAGGSSGDTGGLPDASGATTSMMITATLGGTLTAGGGSLWIPGGALAADKTITLSVRAPTASDPGHDNLVGNIFEFGPDGTTFAVPVSLTLPLATTVPADKKVVVAWLDTVSGQWFPVESTASADKVVGRVSHFTHFALYQLDKGDVCPFAGACGGSLDGTWKYSASCLSPEEDPAAVPCGDAGPVASRTEYFLGGTVNIAGATYTATQEIKVALTLFYHPACMAYLRDNLQTASCAVLQQAWRDQNKDPQHPANWICAGTIEQGCSCQLTNGATLMTKGSVAVTGDKVAFTQEGKPADPPGDYCVKGNTLTVHDDDGQVYTAVKQ
jgi:hypothetical protein